MVYLTMIQERLLTIRCARPSTIAVLPTPGSPAKYGIVLVYDLKYG